MQSAGYEPHPRKITPLLMGKTPLKMKIFLTSCNPPSVLKIKIVQLKHKQPIYTESTVNKLQVF